MPCESLFDFVIGNCWCVIVPGVIRVEVECRSNGKTVES